MEGPPQRGRRWKVHPVPGSPYRGIFSSFNSFESKHFRCRQGQGTGAEGWLIFEKIVCFESTVSLMSDHEYSTQATLKKLAV